MLVIGVAENFSREMLRVSTPMRVAAVVSFVISAGGFAGFCQTAETNGTPAAVASPGKDLTLADFMQSVVEHNEAVQARLLAFHAARSQRRAENGAFEPTLFATGGYVDRDKPNTIEVERSLRSGGVFSERNQNYATGVEMATPIGTRFRVGATGNELINNIQRTVLVNVDAEYETQVGITIEQPLLKGFGSSTNLAALRMAARTSEVAFQEYRRQFMQVIADAEVTYWQLYFAQQELRLSTESVALANTLVNDTRASLETGRGSRLDVLEAEAGLAVRKSREALSRQRRVEALNRMAAFLGGAPSAGAREFVAVEAPKAREIDVLSASGTETALVMSPDLLRASAQVSQEEIRVRYARNQRLPQLDLKTSFGVHGLGYNWRSSWNDIQRRDFGDWAVSLEMRIPVWGGVRGRNELRAARQRMLQAERVASDLGTQLRTGLNTVQQRVNESYDAAQRFQTVVEFRTNLLDTRLKSRDVGRVDSRAVLEAEQDLFAARLDQLQSEIEYQKALLDLQVISGTLLQGRGLEVSFAELEQRTSTWATKGGGQLPTLRYRRPVFDRWPMAPAEPFVGEPDPSYPWRMRLTRTGAGK